MRLKERISTSRTALLTHQQNKRIKKRTKHPSFIPRSLLRCASGWLCLRYKKASTKTAPLDHLPYIRLQNATSMPFFHPRGPISLPSLKRREGWGPSKFSTPHPPSTICGKAKAVRDEMQTAPVQTPARKSKSLFPIYLYTHLPAIEHLEKQNHGHEDRRPANSSVEVVCCRPSNSTLDCGLTPH